jgi:hypothetical protein
MEDRKKEGKRVVKRPGIVLNHMIKNSKALHADKAQLTRLSIKRIVEHCIAKLESEPLSALVLASVFTGQKPSSLIESYKQSLSIEGMPKIADCFLLLSYWQFPPFHPKNVADSILHQPSSTGWIVLPKSLQPSFERLLTRGYEHIDKQISSFLSEIPNDFSQRITLAKLTQVIRYYADDYSLSRSELEFIANTPLENDSQSAYGYFSLKAVNEKLCAFTKDISNKYCFSSMPTLPSIMFGSLRVADDSTVQKLFDFYQSKVVRRPIVIDDERNSFNVILFFVISLLEICTLQRPANQRLLTIDNFDLESGYILIRDKADDSCRVLPLPQVAIATLRTYIKYLKSIIKKHRFTYKSVSNCLESALDGSTNLFNVWSGNELQPFYPRHNSTHQTQAFPLPKNWARQYACNYLIHIAINRNDIAVFMGHASSPDISYSVFNSSDFEMLINISKALDELINAKLGLPKLWDIIL